jgi:hypothetical protein
VPRLGGCRITQRRRYGGKQAPLRDITTGDILVLQREEGL